MPIRTWIDVEQRLVRGEVSGAFSMEEILDAIDGALTDPAYEPGFHILTDHRRVERVVSTPQVKRTVAHLAAVGERIAGARWAAVTHLPTSYGMIRMLSALAERIPLHVRPFETMEEALAWLAEGDGPPGPSERLGPSG